MNTVQADKARIVVGVDGSPQAKQALRWAALTWPRYRGVSTQNSLPSGSAMTTQLTSP
jgi:hypothetical protein